MKNIITILFVIATSLNLRADEQQDVRFFSGTVEMAKEKALKENKLYFIEFYAKWCEPCKWMDEYTFKNTDLSTYISGYYVPVKVDVESVDGFAWKQKYKVHYLPTIVVCNGSGIVLGKYEKSMAAADLMRILKNHQQAPGEIEAVAVPVKTNENVEAKPAFITVHREPGLPKVSEVAKPKTSSANTNLATEAKPSLINKLNSVPANSYLNTKKNGEPSSASEKFRVQVGVYSDASNAFKSVDRLKRDFKNVVQVFNNKNTETNIVTYRVTIGKFNTKEEASVFVQELKTKGILGVVKHITELDSTMKP